MFTYAGGSFITGPLGDRFSPSFIVGLGLLGSTVCLLLITIGASVPALADSASLGLFWFAGTQFIHGFFQATGGPVNTAIMGNWFSKKGRGLIFGLWTCHQYVGDIVAAFAGAWILDSSLNWRMAIVIPLVLNGLWAAVNLSCVPNRPQDIGLETAETREQEAKALAAGKSKDSEPSPISIKEAFLLPNVRSNNIVVYFFKKLTSLSFLVICR